MNGWKKIKTALKIILLLGIALFMVALNQKETLPQKNEILKDLYKEPLQTEIKRYAPLLFFSFYPSIS